MNKRYHVILNNGHDMRKCDSVWDDKDDAIIACQHAALSCPFDTFTVIDTQPQDYKYDVYYAEFCYNMYTSIDGESWTRIDRQDAIKL
jgi:hypothetical protein